MSWTPNPPSADQPGEFAVIEHEDWGTVHLCRSGLADAESGIDQPYVLRVLDYQGLSIIEYPLSLGDLRQLHHRLTDELVRVSTRGRVHGRGRS